MLLAVRVKALSPVCRIFVLFITSIIFSEGNQEDPNNFLLAWLFEFSVDVVLRDECADSMQERVVRHIKYLDHAVMVKERFSWS